MKKTKLAALLCVLTLCTCLIAGEALAWGDEYADVYIRKPFPYYFCDSEPMKHAALMRYFNKDYRLTEARFTKLGGEVVKVVYGDTYADTYLDDVPQAHIEYTWDEATRTLTETTTPTVGQPFVYTYTYDSSDRLIKIDCNNTVKVIYDQQGNISEMDVDNSGYFYTYNEQNELTAVSFLFSLTDKYKEDVMSVQLEGCSLTYYEQMGRYESILDTQGRPYYIIKKRTFMSYEELDKHTLTYDENGCLVKVSISDPNEYVLPVYVKLEYQYERIPEPTPSPSPVPSPSPAPAVPSTGDSFPLAALAAAVAFAALILFGVRRMRER